MRATIGLMLAAGLLWSAPAMAQIEDLGAMSPANLYAVLYFSETQVICTEPGDPSADASDQAYHARFLKIRPWLVAAIGEAEFERLKEDLIEQEGTADYFGCPSDHDMWVRDYRHNRVLQEMERRARAARRAKR